MSDVYRVWWRWRIFDYRRIALLRVSARRLGYIGWKDYPLRYCVHTLGLGIWDDAGGYLDIGDDWTKTLGIITGLRRKMGSEDPREMERKKGA